MKSQAKLYNFDNGKGQISRISRSWPYETFSNIGGDTATGRFSNISENKVSDIGMSKLEISHFASTDVLGVVK